MIDAIAEAVTAEAIPHVVLLSAIAAILPEGNGRVAEVNVGITARVEKGQQLFRLDSSRQDAAVETARRKIAQVDSDFVAAQAELQKVDGQLQEARSNLQQAVDELETKRDLVRPLLTSVTRSIP